MTYPRVKPQLKKLKTSDFPDESVTVVLDDGSTFRIRNAFFHHEGDWIAVYSSTAGYHLFPLAKISSVKGNVYEENDRFAYLGFGGQ